MFAAKWMLVLVASAVAVDCACPEAYEPLNKTMRRLTMNGSMTWNDARWQCYDQFPGGFLVLGRDFLRLSDGDRALCQGHSVPLRLRKETEKSVFWAGSYYLNDEGREEKVSGTFWESKLADKTQTDANVGVGSLNLSSGHWHLVDEDTAFDCVICQRAWIGGFGRLDVSPPSRPSPFRWAFTFRVVATGNASVSLDEAIRLAEERMTQNEGGDLMHVKIMKVDSESGGVNGTSLRMKSTSFSVSPEDVNKALRGTFKVESWQDKDACSASSFQGFDWEGTRSGTVQKVLLADFHVATRRCGWRLLPDKDQDAIWDDQVYIWIDREKTCRANAVSSLKRSLEDFARQVDPDGLDLRYLVETTSDFRSLALPIDVANLTHAIVGVLSSLLVATTTNASSACHSSACAFLAADFQGAETLLISRENAPLRFLCLPTMYCKTNVCFASKFGAANQTTFMSLHLPRESTSAGRVAGHAWGGLNNLFSMHQNITNNSMLVHVVWSRPFDDSDPEGSRPAVIFRLNNTGVDFIDRYRSVWSLGERVESSRPCIWVSGEGAIDTYWCNKWVRGPRDFTTGTFIVSKLESHSDFPELIEDQVLLGYKTIPLDQSALDRVVAFLNFNLQNSRRGNEEPHWSFVYIMDHLETFVNDVVLSEESVFTASLDYVKVLVSNLTVRDPVVGFSLDRLTGAGAVQTVTAGSRNVSVESEVDIVLGAGVQEHCQQLAVLVVGGMEDYSTNSSIDAYIKRKLMIVNIVVTSSSSGNVFFEIQILGESGEDDKNIEDDKSCRCRFLGLDEEKVKVTQVNHSASQSSVIGPILRVQVAMWSETERDWLVSSCATRRSTRASKLVVRCERLPFAEERFRGRYLIFEPVGFAEAFSATLLTVLIAAGILSGVSLASIAATAAALPAWRKDLGHRILLQMALALSFNLVLGFQSSLFYVDTASVACVAVGALRHFSYLAMFAWMLVMSGLQMRRMLSVLSSKTTSNLLLKVAFFAWGVPTMAVGSLLTFKTDMYQSDAADRGFCYPEGVAFRWSVQAPAATVLALNALIFAVILARVFSFWGWGKTEDLRRHLNEHTVQMRRLRAVFYTFLLFGMTWVFHLLAEQGVFQDKYLYEYLFLMTASVHVFSLSCIFVFFDREVWAEWIKVGSRMRNGWANWHISVGTWLASVAAWLASVANRIVLAGERIQAEQLL